MESVMVSFFRGKRYPGVQHVNVSRILDSFKSGKFRNEIEKARKFYAEGDIESYNIVKGKLVAVTFSGIFFPTRSAENIQSYSGFIVLDIDKAGENLKQYFSMLKTDKYVCAVWLSPSGDGIKVLIRTSWDVGIHKEVYFAAVAYYKDAYSISVDTTGSDVSRLCYVSHDPNIYVNNEAVLFNERKQMSLAAQLIQERTTDYERNPAIHTDKQNQKNELSKKEALKKIYQFLRKRGLSITNTYDDWVRLAFAISNTFNYDFGFHWYIQFCKLDGEYFDEKESIKLINNSYESGMSTSTFGTIIYLAKKVGYVPNYNRLFGKDYK